MKSRLFCFMILTVLLIGQIACSGGGTSSSDDSSMNLSQTNLSGTVQPDPNDQTASGQNSGATVYVIGQQDNGTTTDSNGNFSLTVDPTLSGTVLSSPSFFARLFKAASTTKVYGLVVISAAKSHGRKTEITVTNGTVDPISTIYINTVGMVSGKAYLQGQTDHTGIRVYIPGTSFQATTDSNGNYTISNVPAGTYDLVRADYPGTVYHYSEIAPVTVITGQTTVLPEMMLQTNVGASGNILINNGDAFTTSKTVKLSIASVNNAVLMALSEDPNFGGVLTWIPVTASMDYTFSGTYSPGSTATVYVKFADISGLTTAGYASASIFIDTNPLATKVSPVSSTSGSTPTLVWSYLAPMPNPTYHVQLATDAAFSNVIEEANPVTVAQHAVTTPLTYYSTYYWRVAIIDNTGKKWSWSGPWSFQIKEAWSFVDGNGPNGINKDVSKNAATPGAVDFNSKLYAIWTEPNSSGIGQVRVVVYNGNDSSPQWTFVDNGINGLNSNSTFQAITPNLSIVNSKLYATWVEYGLTSVYELRVAVYNGNDAAPSWSFVDGGPLNLDLSQNAILPQMAAVNNSLYVTWIESGISSTVTGTVTANRVRIKKYNGNDSSPNWSSIAPDAGQGLNKYNTDANNPQLAAFGSTLYAVWSENTDSFVPQIRVASYVSGTSWKYVDSPGTDGINYDKSKPADYPTLVQYNSKLYALWEELDSVGVPVVRASVFNGNDSSPAWSYVGGNASGMNFDATRLSQSPVAAVVHNSRIYAAWSEQDAITQYGIDHIATYNGNDAAPSWLFADKGSAGINYDPTRDARRIKLVEHNSALYAVFRENNSGGIQQIRVIVGK